MHFICAFTNMVTAIRENGAKRNSNERCGKRIRYWNSNVTKDFKLRD